MVGTALATDQRSSTSPPVPETAPPPEDFTKFREWSRAQERGEKPPKEEETKLPEAPAETPKEVKPPAETAAESGTEEEEEQDEDTDEAEDGDERHGDDEDDHRQPRHLARRMLLALEHADENLKLAAIELAQIGRAHV